MDTVHTYLYNNITSIYTDSKQHGCQPFTRDESIESVKVQNNYAVWSYFKALRFNLLFYLFVFKILLPLF